MRTSRFGRARPVGWVGLLVSAACLACVAGPEESRDRATRSLVDRGDIALALQRPDEAAAEYAEALALSPGDADARIGLARAERAAGRLEAAWKAYGGLADRDRWDALRESEICPLLLALAHQRLERANRAGAQAIALRAVAERCSEAAWRDVRTRLEIAEAETEQAEGDTVGATDRLEAAARARPDLPDLQRLAAARLLEAGRTREALTLLSEALRHHPEDRALQGLMVEALGGGAGDPPLE